MRMVVNQISGNRRIVPVLVTVLGEKSRRMAAFNEFLDTKSIRSMVRGPGPNWIRNPFSFYRSFKSKFFYLSGLLSLASLRMEGDWCPVLICRRRIVWGYVARLDHGCDRIVDLFVRVLPSEISSPDMRGNSLLPSYEIFLHHFFDGIKIGWILLIKFASV